MKRTCYNVLLLLLIENREQDKGSQLELTLLNLLTIALFQRLSLYGVYQQLHKHLLRLSHLFLPWLHGRQAACQHRRRRH